MILLVLIPLSVLYAETKDEYRIVTAKILNLREGPGINYKQLIDKVGDSTEKIQLNITYAVRVIKISDKEDIVDGKKGRWVYVDPGYSDKTNGWVFDYYLAKREDFKPLNSLPNNLDLVYDFGDALIHFKFFKDGSAWSIDDKEKKSLKGKLYIDNKNRIVIIKYDDQNELQVQSDAFIFLNGKICRNSIELDKTCSRVVE